MGGGWRIQCRKGCRPGHSAGRADRPGDRSDGNDNYYSTIGAGTAIDLSALPAGMPDAMVRSYAYTPAGADNRLSYQLGAPDGPQQLVLYFVEPSNIALGARKFDVVVNGSVVAADVDIRALAGTYNKAVALTLDVNVTGGQGLKLELVNKSANYGALLSGIELRRANAGGVANPALRLEASVDGGASWATVATGLTMDRFGRGQVQWTPDSETAGNSARLRIVATVIFPNIRAAMVSGAFLTFAIVIGEFTMASLLNRPAFGPYLQLIGANRAYEPSALAIIAFLVTWGCMGLINLFGISRITRAAP